MISIKKKKNVIFENIKLKKEITILKKIIKKKKIAYFIKNKMD